MTGSTSSPAVSRPAARRWRRFAPVAAVLSGVLIDRDPRYTVLLLEVHQMKQPV
jgi:hypothetical protein